MANKIITAPTDVTLSLNGAAAALVTNLAAGVNLAQVADPYAGQGYAATTYTTFGTLPPQLAQSSNNIDVGSTYATAGVTYTIGFLAIRGDGMAAIGTQFSFTAVAGLNLVNQTLVAGVQAGTNIDYILGVPAGATPTFTPNDGRFQVVGDGVNGWRLTTGATAASAGTVAGTLSATGVASFAVNLTITAAATQPTTGYYFASTRLRSPNNVGAVTAGLEHQISVLEFYSPPVATNNFRCAYPGHYSNSNAANPPCGLPMPNAIDIEGAYLCAFVSSAWQSVQVQSGGSAGWTVNPGVGMLSDDVNFGTAIPANTRMQIRTAFNVPVGGSIVAGVIISQAVAQTSPARTVASVEGATGNVTSMTSQLTAFTKPTGTDARLNGASYCPSFVVGKPSAPLDRPVFLHYGDSKTYGYNENNTYLATKYLSASFAARAFDDDTASRRMMAHIFSIPSMGAPALLPETSWGIAGTPDNVWGLMQLVPNRPYTHITTDHYNNQSILVSGDPTYRARFSQYYGKLLGKSTYWGNIQAPLFQFRPIPRPGSFATTLAGENPGSESLANASSYNRWALDADLVAGNIFAELTGPINTNTNYAYDQSTNRDKVVLANAHTLAAAYTSGATTISLSDLPAIDDLLILAPSLTAGSAYVRSFTGTGPYTVSLRNGVAIALPSGAVVQMSYVSDSQGLHPSAAGHVLIGGPSGPVVAWKQATFG